MGSGQAAREGHQETTGEEQSGPAGGGNAASSSQRPAHLPWPPPTPPVPTRDRASSQHEDARDPPVVLRENPNAPPTPEEAYSFETDFSEEEVDEQGIPLADKEPGSPAPSSESEDKMAASSGAANHDGDTSPAEESVEESSEAAASDVVFIKATPPPHAERAEYLLIKTIREVKQEDSGDEVASPHVVATPQPNRRNATASWHHLPSKVWLLKSPIYNSQATVRLERLAPYGQNRVTYGFEDQGSGVKLVLKLGAHGDEVGLSRTYSGFCASVVWHGTLSRKGWSSPPPSWSCKGWILKGL